LGKSTNSISICNNERRMVQNNTRNNTEQLTTPQNMSVPERCNICNKQDTLRHRMTGGKIIWIWTCNKMAMILRMDHRYIPQEWIMRPQFRLRPPQKHRTILWIIAHIALYRGQQRREFTFNDYMDFLRRHKWKMYQQPKRREQIGNYLSVIAT
jgi:hypothetical protein